MAKRKNLHDPHAAREAAKYPHPIPSRELILSILEQRGEPATCEELLSIMKLETAEEQEAIRRRLKAMERDGQLVSNRRGSYGPVNKMNLVAGYVIGHRDGYGFVVADDGGEDLFLSAHHMRSVFNGDRVLVRVANIDRRGRREGALVEVLEHKTTQVVGRFLEEDGIAFVVPDNKRISQDIIIPAEARGIAKHGQIVTAAITTQPSVNKRPIGRVIEVLGDHMAPGMEIDIAIRSHALPHIWPSEVLSEVDQLQPIQPGQHYSDREDIRALPLVTIDGEDAADFDDAVYCEPRRGGGWQLIVAIADVSHYVQLDTALDTEAVRRGNSVYFPGYVIPMLPEILANDLCSLKPFVDRFCMVCDMQISATGKLTRYQFYPAVMQSKYRFTYNRVAELLKGKMPQQQEIALVPQLQHLYDLYHMLRLTREARGAIDFETIETRVIFGSQRKIEQIVPLQRNDAHKIIEECMLCANVATARFLLQNQMPALYRIHEGPTAEKLTDLREFLGEFSLSLKGGKEPQPSDYATLLNSITKRPDAHLIQTVLLRSLRQAVYSPNNVGHFGLAYPAYTHFTSPIRRYPDLLVHRTIRHILAGGTAEDTQYDIAKLIQIGEECSITERRADEATRDAMDSLKCEYMLERVGQEFPGIITAVTGFGLFIELTDIYIEGLVHISNLKNDYYQFDPIKHRLTGQRTGVRYRLGDKVLVKVAKVNLDDKKIDLEMMLGTATPKKTSFRDSKTPPKISKKNNKHNKHKGNKPNIKSKKKIKPKNSHKKK